MYRGLSGAGLCSQQRIVNLGDMGRHGAAGAGSPRDTGGAAGRHGLGCKRGVSGAGATGMQAPCQAAQWYEVWQCKSHAMCSAAPARGPRRGHRGAVPAQAGRLGPSHHRRGTPGVSLTRCGIYELPAARVWVPFTHNSNRIKKLRRRFAPDARTPHQNRCLRRRRCHMGRGPASISNIPRAVDLQRRRMPGASWRVS